MGRSGFNATRPWYSKLKEFNTKSLSPTRSCDSAVEFGSRRSRNLNEASRPATAVEVEAHSLYDSLGIVSETAEPLEAKCKFSPTHKPITLCPIETRLSNGEELWDHEFSSMSSYRSDDLDVIGALKRVGSSSDSLPQEGASDNGASCSRSETEGAACDAETDHGRRRREYTKLRRRERTRESLSAALPSDLVGAAASSIALVKQSYDPYEDFRESITEMIRDKEIYKGPELEELLYCYISLNSAEHHDLIRLVFVEVLIDLHLHHGRIGYD